LVDYFNLKRIVCGGKIQTFSTNLTKLDFLPDQKVFQAQGFLHLPVPIFILSSTKQLIDFYWNGGTGLLSRGAG
jgi:hypothetical protein